MPNLTLDRGWGGRYSQVVVGVALTQTRRRRRAFSLIELLSVIAIIGILAAILIPTVGGVMDNARKAVAASNLRQIATAYNDYISQQGNPSAIAADSIYEWARVLAQYVNFNDARIYYLTNDPLVIQQGGPLPAVVAVPPLDGAGDWLISSDFSDFPLSFAVAARLGHYNTPSQTPVAWTRGLNTEGTWNDFDHPTNPGVYGSSGGHIVFLDGHVEFFADGINDRLVNATTKQPTSNILEALGPGATILQYTPAVGDGP